MTLYGALSPLVENRDSDKKRSQSENRGTSYDQDDLALPVPQGQGKPSVDHQDPHPRRTPSDSPGELQGPGLGEGGEEMEEFKF